MLRAVLLSRPKPPQAGAKGQPLQGHSSQRQLSTKVSGPPLAAASTPGRRAESTASAGEIHPLKIQKSHIVSPELPVKAAVPSIGARMSAHVQLFSNCHQSDRAPALPQRYRRTLK